MRAAMVLIIAICLAGCHSTPVVIPDNTPAIIETQTAVAADAATVVAEAGQTAEEAREIVEVARETGNVALVKKAEKHVETTEKLELNAKKLQIDVDLARKETVTLLGTKAIAEAAYQAELIAHEKTKSALFRTAIVFFLAGAIGVLMVIFAIKYVKPP